MLKKLMWGGIVLVVVAIGALVAVAFFMGSGEFHVVAPATTAVTVTVDGKDVGPVPAGAHRRFAVAQGARAVKVSTKAGARDYKLDVKNGGFSQVLPAPAQCLALFDVRNYWYEKKGALEKTLNDTTIPVKEKHAADKAFDASSGAFYTLAELPEQIEKNRSAEVMLEVPCPLLQKSDAELVGATFKKP